MLLNNICKNVCNNPRLRYYGVLAANKIKKLESNKLPNFSCLQEKRMIDSVIKTTNCGEKRFYSALPNEELNPPVRLSALTDDPLILMPSFFKSIKSSYNLHFVMQSQIDKEFDMHEFADGSKQAVEMVSHTLAAEDYDSLQGLVTPDVIQKLRYKISTLSEAQKQLIPVKKEEIYGMFPYTIDIVSKGDEGRERLFVEITMTYYCLKGFGEMQKRGEIPPLQMGLMPEYREKIFLVNCRFSREYTENVSSSSWVINQYNELMLVTA
ncbi:GSCOCG00000056001-RA-CDS [Cotesia congregata]|nr:GSCOCG00000056001-RA-CDS [Cotesia congregata]